MRLSQPTHIRLTLDLLQRLDSWRGDRMNRATAIRLLLEQALKKSKWTQSKQPTAGGRADTAGRCSWPARTTPADRKHWWPSL